MTTVPVPGVTSLIGGGLLAQRERLGLIASNMANADSVATPGSQPFRAMEPVFAAIPAAGRSGVSSVAVAGVVQSAAPPQMKYDPASPFANPKGYVAESNVNPVEQMTDLIDASQSYQSDISILDQNTKLSQTMIQSFVA